MHSLDIHYTNTCIHNTSIYLCLLYAAGKLFSNIGQLTETVSCKMKALVTNRLAKQFNSMDSRNKQSFSDLKLSTVVCGKLIHL